MVERAILHAVLASMIGFAICTGCGKVGNSRGGETNWLDMCNSDADCRAPATCLCGVCTDQCTNDATCAGIATTVCVQHGTAAFERTCGSDATISGACLPSAISLADARDASAGGDQSGSPRDAGVDTGVGKPKRDASVPVDPPPDAASRDASSSDGRVPVDASPHPAPPDGSPGNPVEAAPCSADFEALPLSAFADCFAYWTSHGMRLQTVAVRPDGTEIAGSFQPGSFDGQVLIAMDVDEFDRERNADRGEPWLVKDLSIYGTTSGEQRYAAIFEPSGGAPVVTFREIEPANFWKDWDTYYNEGFILTELLLEPKGTRELYSGTWVKRTPFLGFPLRFYEMQDEFEYVNDLFVKDGFRVTHLFGFENESGIHYSALWEIASVNRFAALSSSTSAYVGDRRRRTSSGYRLERVQLFGSESYSAIWVGPHDVCSTGSKLLDESDPCARIVCLKSSSCCTSAWVESCVADAQGLCGRCL